MSIMYPDLSNQQAPGSSANAVAQDSQRAGLMPDQPATVGTPFQPLDPSIVNAAIPSFFIGRNHEGFWLARDVKGQIGGIFLFESSALAFARRNAWPSGCATIFPSERFELDLENQGNPFITYLRPLMRLVEHGRRRTAALTGKMVEAVERRFRDFHAL
ncbi:MAG: hypothetical protein ACLQDM_09050 [Bradyrhizobium sp.]